MIRLMAAALVLAAAGCAQSDSPPPASVSGTVTSVTITAAPPRSTGYAQRMRAKVRVDDGDGLALTNGALWVKTDDGRVVRVNPSTNRVTGEVRVDTSTDPSTYCQGIAAVRGAVWACSATGSSTDVAEVDTSTLAVTRRARVDKVFDQLSMPSAAGKLWVLSDNGTQVTQLDEATAEMTATPLGTRCLQLAAAGDLLVATCATQSVVLLVEPRTGKVTGRTTLPEPRLAAVLGDEVWVDTAKGLTRLRKDLSVAATYPSLSAGLGGDLVAAAGAIWVRAGNGTITKIDATTGAPLERITPEVNLTPGSLLVTNDSIWTTSSDDGLLYRLGLR